MVDAAGVVVIGPGAEYVGTMWMGDGLCVVRVCAIDAEHKTCNHLCMLVGWCGCSVGFDVCV